MKSRRLTVLLLLLFTLCFGVVLRFWHYDIFPPERESLDELAWTLQGASILATGIPRAWSHFDYENFEMMYMQGSEQRIVSPYLDHPPLFGFIPGSIQFLFGETWSDVLPTGLIRLPVVILACLNLGLFWFVTQPFFPRLRWRYLAFLLYAALPFVVMSSRVIVAEQLLITWVLLGMILIFSKSHVGIQHLLLLLIGSSLVLTKISGVVLGVGLLVLALIVQKKREAIWLFFGLCLGVLFVLVYAFWFDWNAFLYVQQQQQSWRSQGLLSAFTGLLMKPELVNSVFFDGFLLTGVLSVFAVISKKTLKVHWKGIIAIVAAYAAFIFFASGETTVNMLNGARGGSLYGWYWYPSIPLFLLLITQWIQQLYEEHNSEGLVAVFSILTLPLFRYSYFILSDTAPTMHSFPRILIMISVAYLLVLWLGFLKSKLATMIVALTVVLLLGVLVTYGFHPSLYWSEGNYWGQI